jgi:hypothetical protein
MVFGLEDTADDEPMLRERVKVVIVILVAEHWSTVANREGYLYVDDNRGSSCKPHSYQIELHFSNTL